MAALAGNITADQTTIPVSGDAPTSGSYFIIGSEAILFLGTSRGPQGRAFLRSYWSVDRGVAGTTKATHSNGATLTQYYPDAAGGVGGSGVTVDNLTDPPAAVTTLVAPGATFDGDSATLAYVLVETKHITSADLLAFQNPVVILPTPGLNKAIVPLAAYSAYTYGSVAYDGSGKGEVAITTSTLFGYGAPDGAMLLSGNLGLNQSYDVIGWLSPQIDLGDGSPTYQARSDIEDASLVIGRIGFLAGFGNGDGTLDVTVYYTVLDLP
jgi:hypothetical protein